jgi:CBS domain-containing protein
MRVADLMNEPAVTCVSTESLQAAVDRMRMRNIGALVVVSEEGRTKAIVTDRDVCITAADAHKPLDALRVDDARSVVALTCSPDDSIDTAQSMMQAGSVRRIVVVDPTNRPLGLLSIDDLAVEALRELERGDAEPAISPAAMVRTLGEIARSVATGHVPIPEGSDALPRPIT